MLQNKLTIGYLLAKRNPIKAILFDLDGTLIDSREGIVDTITGFLQKKGNAITRGQVNALFGKPIEVVFQTLVPNITEDEAWSMVKEIRIIFAEKHLSFAKLLPNVKSILKKLKDKGFKLGVASTKYKSFVVEELEYSQIDEFFDVIVSGYEVEHHKPAPDILFEAAKQLELVPEACVYFGDSITDIIAGKAADMLTVGVLSGAATLEQMKAEKPDMIIQDLSKFEV